MKRAKKVLIVVVFMLIGMLCAGNVSAAESITVEKVWNVNGVNFRNTTSSKPAYCMHKTKSGPTKGTKLL